MTSSHLDVRKDIGLPTSGFIINNHASSHELSTKRFSLEDRRKEMAEVEEKGETKGELHGFTQDGTVDLKGRPVLRSQGGRWTACSFIVGK